MISGSYFMDQPEFSKGIIEIRGHAEILNAVGDEKISNMHEDEEHHMRG